MNLVSPSCVTRIYGLKEAKAPVEAELIYFGDWSVRHAFLDVKDDREFLSDIFTKS